MAYQATIISLNSITYTISYSVYYEPLITKLHIMGTVETILEINLSSKYNNFQRKRRCISLAQVADITALSSQYRQKSSVNTLITPNNSIRS